MSRRPHPAEPDPSTFPTRHYDLAKEFTVASVAALVLTFALASVFSSPDERPVTIAGWSKADPADFTATALSELDGTSTTATYGPPYNNAAQGQKLGPLALAQAAGVTHPIDTASAFVLGPLQTAPQNPQVTAALATYTAATPATQNTWNTDYTNALAKANGDPAGVAPGEYGLVPVLLRQLLNQAQTGSLDGTLLSEGGFYQTDYTLPLLFLADGGYLADKARGQHLAGDQWGMMNETGNYPGQPWLWL